MNTLKIVFQNKMTFVLLAILAAACTGAFCIANLVSSQFGSMALQIICALSAIVSLRKFSVIVWAAQDENNKKKE